MDAVTAITNDHRLLEKLFEQLKQDPDDRVALLEEIRARLLAHIVAEETFVYPVLEQADPSEAGEVHHGVDEHREAEEKLGLVETADEQDFSAALQDFIDAVSHHVEEEETELLPALAEAVGAQGLKTLGADFEQRRIAELEEWNLAPTE